MFEDPGLQDPLSLSLNGKYCGQTSGQQKERKAPGSLGYTCDPPEIQVVIKEEDENWTKRPLVHREERKETIQMLVFLALRPSGKRVLLHVV
ncbi:hypothetical protein XENOCAPTIV_023467 [Xenoophorus captivus]|uniref:KRAB domain-containing protein n=1 Tax=Xenoophorus captivus TaxID=1517983 RepID=A0ABV0QE75_9TELE